MGLYGRALLHMTERLRGSRSLRILSEIADAPFADPEEVRERQLEKLRGLLEHAELRVPYYRRMFAELGIEAADIRSFRDFSQLPVLTKDVIRDNRDELIREDVSSDELIQHSSGGSTGVPLTFFSERSHLDWSDAGTYRNFLQCGWQPGDMVAFFWGDDPRIKNMSRLEFEARQHIRRTYQFSAFRSGPEEMDRWIGVWRRIRPAVANGYASVIANFAKHLLATDTRLPRLKGVYSTAEKLYDWQRETIEEAFGCKVYDCYGSSEVRNVSTECPRGSMHVNADYVVLEEAERDEGASEEDGRPLIVTSLINYGMPFIRYRNEDRGGVLSDSCDCGRGFPLMSLDISRTTDSFPLPNGRVVHGLFFVYLLYGSEGVANFQFYQPASERIEVRIVPAEGWSRERLSPLLDDIHHEIDQLAPGMLTVNLQIVEEIPRTRRGKHRYTRSDVRFSGVAADPSPLESNQRR